MSDIRLAMQTDCASLVRLRYSFRSIPDADSETEIEFRNRCTNWMSSRLRQDNWRCWVVEQEDEIIGALWLQIIEKIPNPTNEPEFHGYITNVFVKESARGSGIGSRLIEMAIDYCKRLPVHAVILWPSEKSRTLYERHGFAARSDLFELIF